MVYIMVFRGWVASGDVAARTDRLMVKPASLYLADGGSIPSRSTRLYVTVVWGRSGLAVTTASGDDGRGTVALLY